MQSKEFSTLITNGKISPHLCIFLQKAFSFSSQSLNSTSWISYEKYKGFFIKKMIAKNALVIKGLDAITLNREVIYSGETVYSHKEELEYAAWLELIVHESYHRNEIEKFGWVYWYFRYAWETIRFGYRNAPSEKRAYAIAMGHSSIMENFLKTELGIKFISVCKDETISQADKNRLMEEIAINYLKEKKQL